MHEGSASPFWQSIFLAFALVLILFEIARGWRLGVVRQCTRIVAIVVAYLCGIFAGKFLVPLLRPFLHAPDIVISIGGGAILALLAYWAIVTLGSILFQRTAQQKFGLVRFFYGGGGALLGFPLVLFTIWLIVVTIRSLGAVADAELQAQARLHRLSSHQTVRSSNSLGEIDSQKMIGALAKLKNSLELGSVGNILKRADFVPASTYQTLAKVGQVFSDPESAERFFSYPGAKKLSEDPRIIALRDDSDVARLLAQGRFFDLLHNPTVIAAANDPALAAEMRTFQFQKALDYAATRK